MYGVSKLKFLVVNKSEILNKSHEMLHCVACNPYIAFSRNLSGFLINYVYNISTTKASERDLPFDSWKLARIFCSKQFRLPFSLDVTLKG